jgi:hypothetical protein
MVFIHHRRTKSVDKVWKSNQTDKSFPIANVPELNYQTFWKVLISKIQQRPVFNVACFITARNVPPSTPTYAL